MEIFEVVVTMAGHTLNATSKAANIGKAIDEAYMKIERQLEKITGKIKDHKNHTKSEK
jgi:ribosomal subunit interface protein